MSEQQILTILHTNDIHSHFEQMAKIATFVRRERQGKTGEETLLLDIGDHMDRMRVETEGTGGLANVEVLNATGYEAVVLGNNEGLTYTPQQLAQAYADPISFQIIGSNMVRSGDGKRPAWLKPYAIIGKGEMSIGLIGVTAAFSDFYRLIDWHVTDPLAAVAECVTRLRGQVDFIVVMSHLGMKHDRMMAEQIPGIDLILGGHTHHLFEKAERIGQTYVCAAGKFGHHVGKVVIEFDRLSRRCCVLEAGCVPVDDLPSHEGIETLIRGRKTEAERNLNETVAELACDLSAETDEESSLGNLLAAALRKWTKADIGLVNAGQFTAPLAAGPVTSGMLHRICPSPINPCRITLTGAGLLRALEEALLPEFTQLEIRGFGFRGKTLGTLCLDGMEIMFHPNNAPYDKIVQVTVGGEPLDAERTYNVGTIDMFTFGIGYQTLKEGTDVQYYLPEFIRDLVRMELQDGDQVRRSLQRRWHRSGA
ncbi:Trifunctional nucleotide phosphoesterase protein YfkN [Paenibacillus sp. CECT 9249]|uniref:bifunctional metallophosphatase/5'-nucleotidase n=1 Tax=Paenibacillus sp. CECT 9249 TaxID=2845385 RepID=UPI001E540723|nr:bifunctional UDP-sugar hydrolase/5'-nucleotidase [Paenibacillus sp. CECT 9249]CAH0117778.1 Trifunctional nucleotide phosphoesterase protein YfkN [Paenibacillus sp. CECT 9249]